MIALTNALAFGLLMSLVGCLGNDKPEFADQARAIARHGSAMRAILRKHPSQRIVVHYEPGEIPDVPHDLVYDPTERDVSRVIELLRDRYPDRLRRCAITGSRVELAFFDLAVDCVLPHTPPRRRGRIALAGAAPQSVNEQVARDIICYATEIINVGVAINGWRTLGF